MKITIRERLRPYSHRFGTSCMIPGSCLALTAFPTKLEVRCLSTVQQRAVVQLSLYLTGPVREFTVQQDLEGGAVLVWGRAKEGRFQFRLSAQPAVIECYVLKAPSEGIGSSLGLLVKGARLNWTYEGLHRSDPVLERLSLGSHRAQDWEMVSRRFCFKEILPVLFCLSQWTPDIPRGPVTQMMHLLDRSFDGFLQAAFSSLLLPRLVDEEHQGLVTQESLPETASACDLLVLAGQQIRRIFFEQQGSSMIFRTPKDFSCGRMINLCLSGIGFLDFEWSNGQLRKAILRSQSRAFVCCVLESPLSSFRLRSSLTEKGVRMEAGALWQVNENMIFYLDRFQK